MDKYSPDFSEEYDGYLHQKAFRVEGQTPDNETLARRIQNGDESAAKLLLSNNERFLNSCAFDLCDRYGMTAIADDLKQEGAMALLEAARRYCFDTGAKFLTYAYPAVKAAMLDYAATASLPAKLPPSRYHQLRRVSYIIAIAPPGIEDAALIETIRTEMGVSKKVAGNLMQESRVMFSGVRLGDKVFDLGFGGNPATRYAAKLRHKHIDELLATLTPRERTVIRKYCGFDDPDGKGMTFEEMAVRLNFNSPSAAEKAFKKAATKLKVIYGKIGNYGSWREAERAFLEAKCESTESKDYSTPQGAWYEEGWALAERFPEEVRALIEVETIFREALEANSAAQPTAETESTVIP